MKKLIFTALLIFPVFLNSGTLPLPYASELTISDETAARERSFHVYKCPNFLKFHCQLTVFYAETCNPLIKFHVSDRTLKTKSTRDGKTLLQIILKSKNGSQKRKTALCCFLIKKGINFNRDLELIILHNDIELFKYMIYKLETDHYSSIISYLSKNRSMLHESFLHECTLTIHDLIEEKTFKDEKNYLNGVFSFYLGKIQREAQFERIPSFEAGSDFDPEDKREVEE